MSKYVYIKSEHKIYPTSHIQKDRIIIKEQLVPIYWLGECYCPPEDYIEFDNFEDLIEVGDLLYIRHEPLTNSPGLMVDYYAEPEISYEYRVYSKWMSRSYPGYIEIWKRLDNIFKRVCHKEDESWVID